MTLTEHRADIAARDRKSIVTIPASDMLALIDIAIDAERLRAGIGAYLHDNYPSPRAHMSGKCEHGIYYPDACEDCISAHFIALLACRECDAAPGDVCPESATGLCAPCGASDEVTL